MDKPPTNSQEKTRNDDIGKLTAHLYQKPSFSNSAALKAIYAEKKLSKKSPPGIDVIEMTRLLEEQEQAISLGDISRVEEMLITQAHVLQAIFSSYVTKAASTSYVDEVQLFMQLALKAQNQCRQTLHVLTDFEKPNQTTYIAQQNNALAQQVHQYERKSTQETANELMERANHESSGRMDLGTKGSTSSTDTKMATMDSVNRADNRKRKGDLRAECLQAWPEVSGDKKNT